MTPLNDYVDIAKLLWPSLISAAATAVAGGVVGTFVLLRREALTALALPQVVTVGAAIGLRLGYPTLPPAMIAVGLAILFLLRVRRQHSRIVALPALYVAGLSFSFLIIANHGQAIEQLQNLFTGIDVAVSPTEAAIAVPIMLASAMICAVTWRRWLLLTQGAAMAEVARVRVGLWEALFLSLLAIVILIGTACLGLVLITALLFLPAAAALPWANRLPAAMLLSVAVALATLLCGFVLSIENSWPMSQSVGASGFVLLCASVSIAKLAGR